MVNRDVKFLLGKLTIYSIIIKRKLVNNWLDLQIQFLFMKDIKKWELTGS